MATSINGYITQGQDDSDWVSETDWEQFNKLVHESGAIVMGKNTYYQFGDDEFPVEGAFNFVLTHDPKLLKKSFPDKALFTDKSPQGVIALAKEMEFEQLMLIGGMKLNTAFMQSGLIDEVWLSVHPLFIGKGKTITEQFESFQKLEFLGSTELENGLIQLRYKVVKE